MSVPKAFPGQVHRFKVLEGNRGVWIEGTPKATYTTNNLPKDPKKLINNGWKETTPEGMAKNTGSRAYIDLVTGIKVRFDPGKPGVNGFEGVNGNPVAKGSKASHIIP